MSHGRCDIGHLSNLEGAKLDVSGAAGVSNDNPFSESLFRTLKYRPEYPAQPFAEQAVESPPQHIAA